MPPLIIGLSGTLASGKGELSSYLKKKGFLVFSLSDIIREEARRRNAEISRDSLVAIGNDLRRKFGNGVLAEEVLKMISLDKNYVIESIRNPSEVEVLRRLPNFKLIFIDAPIDVRFQRALERNRESESDNFDDFKKAEERELESQDSSSQQLLECKRISDFILVNDSSFEDFYKNAEELIKIIEMKIEESNFE